MYQNIIFYCSEQFLRTFPIILRPVWDFLGQIGKSFSFCWIDSAAKSLKASSKGLDKIKKAMKQIQTEKGWTLDNDNWLDEAIKFLPMERIGDTEVPGTVSIGSWKRFYFV